MARRRGRASRIGRWIGFAVGVLVVGAARPGPAPAGQAVLLATTTSTQDSGLLEVLVPVFERRTGSRVKTIAVGTGKALALTAQGEADVCLVHAPESEKQYVAEGRLRNRRLVMHNDFVLVGPAEDPARVGGLGRAAEAFTRVAQARAPFVSRGDNSGTHQREQALWREAGVVPRGSWYLEAGQGMGATLVIASEKRAYTLTDRGTFLAFWKRLQLVPLVERDRALLNIYSVLEPEAGKFPRVNITGGRAFADFLLSEDAQEIIRTFGIEKFGQPLFIPDAGKREDEL